MNSISVWIVDDDSEVLAYLSEQIRAHAQLHLLAQHATRQAALQWLAQQPIQADALLCDLGLPDGAGQDVIRAATQKWPQCDAMVISMFGDEFSVLSSIEAGAVGYIHKDAPWGDLAKSILDMKAGAAPMSPMIARGVLYQLRGRANISSSVVQADKPHSRAPESEDFHLSAKEGEVLALIARGFSYAEIAGILQMSIHTVQSHIKNLYRKMAVHSRGEAVFEAQRTGILRDI